MTEDNAALRRIEQAIARLGADHVPPPGWETRVMAAIHAGEKPAPHHSRWRVVAMIAGAVAVVIFVVGVFPRPSPPRPLELALEVVPKTDGHVMRSPVASDPDRKTAVVDDTVEATAQGGDQRAIWVYRPDGSLLMVCPGATGCQATGDSLTVRFQLTSLGVHRIIAVRGDDELPSPTGNYDADLAGLVKAGTKNKIDEVDAQ